MTVAIDILVIGGDGLAPMSAALEVNVLDVGTGVNDVDIDTLTTLVGEEVLVEGSEGQRLAVGDAGQTPWGHLLGLRAAVFLLLLDIAHGVDDGVPLNGLDLFVMLLAGVHTRCVLVWMDTWTGIATRWPITIQGYGMCSMMHKDKEGASVCRDDF